MTFFANNESLTKTASELYAHRHTVRYRLEKIADISGLSVFQTEHKERLGLGLKARSLFISLTRTLATSLSSRSDCRKLRQCSCTFVQMYPPLLSYLCRCRPCSRPALIDGHGRGRRRLCDGPLRPRRGSVNMAGIDTGDTAWMLISTALVMLMTPGLAFFYGGLVRRKNVLSIMMQCFMLIGVISIQWVLFGYSLAFGPDHGGLIGGLSWAGTAAEWDLSPTPTTRPPSPISSS